MDKRFSYDRIAGQFDSQMDQYDLHTRLRLAFDGFLGKDDLQDKLLLDAGCGTGWFTQWAIARGAKVISLDIGRSLLKETKVKGGIYLTCGDLLHLPFPNKYFEYIICSEAIEHTINPQQAIYELSRVLAPGGSLVLTTPNKLWQPLELLSKVFGIRKYCGYENWVTWDDLYNWFQEAHLDIECKRGFHILPFQIKWTHFVLDYFNEQQYFYRYMINIGILGRKKV